jgi:hypothetical protein
MQFSGKVVLVTAAQQGIGRVMVLEFGGSRASPRFPEGHRVIMRRIVIDTNVFVAAGFNPKSAAARILTAIREGRLQLIWNDPTRREAEMIHSKLHYPKERHETRLSNCAINSPTR